MLQKHMPSVVNTRTIERLLYASCEWDVWKFIEEHAEG